MLLRALLTAGDTRDDQPGVAVLADQRLRRGRRCRSTARPPVPHRGSCAVARTMSVPTARAAPLCAPPLELTVISICVSP